MQLSRTTIPNAAAHTHMFSRKENRIEFIVDFPKNDDAEIISSIQVISLLLLLSLFRFFQY